MEIFESLKKAVELCTCGKIEGAMSLSDEAVLEAAKRYYEKYGYLPEAWMSYISKRILTLRQQVLVNNN